MCENKKSLWQQICSLICQLGLWTWKGVDKVSLVHAFMDTIVYKCLSNHKRNDDQSPFHAHNHVYSKKRLLGKLKKTHQPKNDHNWSPSIHTTTSIRKMFPKTRKKENPPSYIMFQVNF